MLEQLVESKRNESENKRLGKYLATTFILVFALCLSGVLWSLFAKDLGIGDAELELSKIVSPIPIAETDPEPELPKQPENSRQSNSENRITRNDNVLQMSETPKIPTEISVKPSTGLARPSVRFAITSGPESNNTKYGRTGENSSASSDFSSSNVGAQEEKPEITIPKPPPIKKAEPEEKKKPVIISDGVVNGKATFLPKPPYPSPARAVGASGAVNVQVTIDEEGNVVSAKAVSGHPLLRDAAERAARTAKFSPTYLSKQPVKVSGLIVYNFTKN